jgi:hypothetical protein
MRKAHALALMLSAVFTLAACGSTGARSAAVRGDRNLVTSDELRQGVASNLYEFLESTRPMWLRKRGQSSILNEGDIVVYLDDNRLGGPETLRSLSTMSMELLRFLDAAAAQQRFGVGHSHGAILVYSRR